MTIGFVYAAIALGYTMVYGVLQFINFAHSEIFALGAFCGVECADRCSTAPASWPRPAWSAPTPTSAWPC